MEYLKKRLSVLMVFALLLGLLSGCGGSKGEMLEEKNSTPVEEEPAEAPPAEELVIAPTPAVFFGVEANTVIQQWEELVFDNDPAQAAAAYVDLLQNAFGFTVTEQSADDRSSRWSLQYGDNENAGLDVSSVFTQAEKYVVTVIYSQNIRWQDGAVYDWPEPDEPVQEPVPEPEAARDDPSVLPDFLAHDSSGSFRLGTTSSDDVVVFLSEADSAWDVAEAYVQRLLDMGYWVSDTEEKSNQFMDVYRWYLTHDDVDGSAVKDSAQVCIKHKINIPYKSDDPYTAVSITFGSGIVYAGESKTDSGSSGSSSSSDTFTPEHAKLDCLKCRGDGDCNTCGGYGEVRKYAGAGETTRAKCDTCRGSGNCKACGGSGKR